MEMLILPICCVALISAHTKITETIEINHWFGMFVLKLLRKTIKRWKEIILGLSIIDFLIHNWIFGACIVVYLLISISIQKILQFVEDTNRISYRTYW
jgi:hypothetical protein